MFEQKQRWHRKQKSQIVPRDLGNSECSFERKKQVKSCCTAIKSPSSSLRITYSMFILFLSTKTDRRQFLGILRMKFKYALSFITTSPICILLIVCIISRTSYGQIVICMYPFAERSHELNS